VTSELDDLFGPATAPAPVIEAPAEAYGPERTREPDLRIVEAIDPITASEEDPKLAAVTAENALLAACFIDPDAAQGILGKLRPRHLTSDDRRAALASIQVATTQGAADTACVADELKRNDAFPHPAVPYIAALLDSCPSAANWPRYLRDVLEAAHRRDEQALREQLRNPKIKPHEQDFVIRQLTELRERATPTESLPPTWSIADLEAEPDEGPVDEMIAGVLVRGGVNVLFGPSGSTKSWALLHLAFLLAQADGYGRFLGIEDALVACRPDGEPERILWCFGSEDSRRRVKKRTLALRREHYPSAPSNGLWLSPAHDLDTPEGLARLRALIEEHRATTLVIDTVSSACTLDPSDGPAVKTWIDALHRLCAEREDGLTIFVVHHTRKGGKEGQFNPYAADNMLGSGSWRNLCDGVVLLHAPDGQVGLDEQGIDLVVVKSKDLESRPIRARVHWDRQTRSYVVGETAVEEKRNDALAREGAVLLAIFRNGPDNVPGTSVKGVGVPTASASRKRAIDSAIERGWITDNGATGRGKRYSLTTRGYAEALELQTAEEALDAA